MIKLMTAMLLSTIVAGSAVAANPYWLEGMTSDAHEITVYRSATCGCCKGWIAHLEDHHFVINDVVVDDVDRFKQQFQVPAQASSCHTAVVNGIVIEGHVPAQDIKRVLADPGDLRLLTVPAMPSGTPGMDFEGAPSQPFRVYALDNEDKVSVYNTYENY